MPLTKKPSDRPSLSPKQAAEYTGGALSYQFLKRDRAEAEANGVPPQIPYYRVSYRVVRYRPSDLDAYLEALRVG